MPTSSTTTADAPLSSLRYVPATDTTLERLREAGVQYQDGLSEHGAQALLALRAELSEDESGAPSCYQRAYDPAAVLCVGCVYSPRCWRSDLAYLHRLAAGTAQRPPGVPDQVVDERVAHGLDRALPPEPPARAARNRPEAPEPPRRGRPAPPPPPRRG